MRVLLILGAGVLALVPPRGGVAADRGESAKAPSIVADVRVAGNKHMTVNAVLANVKTRAGHAYDDAIVRADQQRLLATGRFQSVLARGKPTDAGMIVTFEVVERPTIAKLVLQGNKAIKTKDLTAE